MPRSRPPGPATPQGPSGPPSPGGPPKRSSRFGKRSKTKNIKCSEAASAWQLAIRRGGSPGSEVYKTLAQCRAGNKTAKAGMAAGTAAGAALAERAVTSRIDRSLATATSRKAELQARIRERAGRTISDADRQRANDIASRVTGKTGGPSAALKRLQGVRASRTRRAATPRAIPDAGQTNRPPEAVRQQIQRNHTPAPSKLDRLRANAADRQSHRENHERERYIAASALTMLRQRGPAGRLEAKNLRRTAYNAVERRSPTGPDWSHSDADRAYMRTNERKVGRQNLMAYEVEARATDSLRRVPPPMVGPKPPRVGLEAYHASRALRTAPGVSESRSAAARGLMALRQNGPTGRSEARSLQSLGGSTSRRGENIVTGIVQMRQSAGRAFHDRGTRAISKGRALGAGTSTLPMGSTLDQNRSAAARELAFSRRLRNASLAATGDRGPRDYWRNAAGGIQVANPRMNFTMPDAAGTGRRVSGVNRPDALARYRSQVTTGANEAAAARQAAADLAAAQRAQAARTAAPASPPATGTTRARVTHGIGTSYSTAQLNEARSHAGTFGDYASQSPHSPAERTAAVRKAGNLGLKLTGRTTDEKFNHLASILGAPPEAAGHIRVRVSQKEISIENTHIHGGGHKRTIKIDPTDNRPMVYNNYYIPRQAHVRAAGMATDHYNRQILAARAAGIQRIRVSGAGMGQGNVDTSGQYATGYHVWVEYGFDGPIGRHGVAAMSNAHPSLANITHTSTFNETVHHPDPAVARAARDAWRRDGTGTNEIGLEIADPSSSSMKVYTNLYRKRRGEDWRQSNVRTNASRAGNYDIYR